MPGAATYPLGADRPGPRGWGVWAPKAPLRLVFWLRESSGEIGFLAYFSGFFLIFDFLHKN